MVSLAGTQLDYCVYQTFNPSLSSGEIFDIVRQVLKSTHTFFFRVIAIIGDGAQCNRSYQKRHFNCGDINNLHMKHPLSKEPIYYISDPSHMIKKIVSSLSSTNRKIYITTVDKVIRRLSLASMFSLWLSFNDSSGLNRFPSFKTIDFIKNSFQSMRVGPCIKVLGPKMIEVIDMALVYQQNYIEFNNDENNSGLCNPYEFYKNADDYLGWREVCVQFSQLFSILNSTENRLNTTNYTHNFNYLKSFHAWFKNWKEVAIIRQKSILPVIHSAYQSMCGFFTIEASEDCLSMTQSIIALTYHYTKKNNTIGKHFFLLPRRISQDLVENAFSRIRLATGHARLDHISTYNAIVEVNMIKEVKSHVRAAKKRNAGGCPEITSHDDSVEDNCIEYAKKFREESAVFKASIYKKNKPYSWVLINGMANMSYHK